MKRLGLLIILSFLLITGCSKKVTPIDLEDKYYGVSEMEDVPSKTIQKLEENEESFVVFVYMASCTSCANFDRVLEDFISEYKIKFYKVSLLNIEGTKMEDKVRYSPSVVVYNKGKVVSYLNAVSDEDMPYYESSDNFKTWLERYVNLKSE